MHRLSSTLPDGYGGDEKMSNAFFWRFRYTECMEMNLIRLRHIVAVARTASFTLAASEEGISQSALSRSIQSFEQHHGVRLFDRGRGGVSVTPAGKLVVEQARSLLGAATELDRSLRLHGAGEAGRVAVGAGPLIASLLLPAVASALLQSRPHLQIVSTIRPPDQMLENLLGDSIEIIIGNNWQLADIPGIDQEHLGTLPLVHVVRQQHPLLLREQVFAADLANYPVAGVIELQMSGVAPTSGAFICENFSILKEVVERTECVWFTSPAILREELASGRLCQLAVIDHELSHTDIYVVRRRGRTRSPAAVALVHAAKAVLDGLTVDCIA